MNIDYKVHKNSHWPQQKTVIVWYVKSVYLWYIKLVYLWFVKPVYLWYVKLVYSWYVKLVYLCYVKPVYLSYVKTVYLCYVKLVYLWYVSHRFWLSCLGPLALFLKHNLMLFGFPIFQLWAYLMKVFQKHIVLDQISTFLLLPNVYMICRNQYIYSYS